MKNIYTLLGEEDKVELITSVLQQLGLAIWLIYDNLMWAAKVGLIKNADTNTWLKRSNQAWLMAMLSAVVKNAYLLFQSEQLIKSTSTRETVVKIRNKQFNDSLELIRNFVDIPLPLTQLSPSVAEHMNSGFVGACGTITSLIGIYQEWKKIK